MIEIQPVKKVSGTVTLPGSKSYTNRALLIAALANGVSCLEKPLVSDDTKYMIQALKGFGIKVEEEPNAFIVSGKAGKLIIPEEDIFVGNAGTAMRFLTTFAALVKGKVHLDGDERMRERPLADLLKCLGQMGIKAIPYTITGVLRLTSKVKGFLAERLPCSETKVANISPHYFCRHLILKTIQVLLLKEI